MIKVGKVFSKYDILTVEEKRVALVGNKTNISLETNPWKRELYARQLKKSKMRIKKIIEK